LLALTSRIAAAEATITKRMEPRPLYVSRPLLNGAAVKAWARKAGVPCTADDAFHVTICYSKRPVDWHAVGPDASFRDDASLQVPPGGPRTLQAFGPKRNVLVLRFNNWQLEYRHREFVEAGASVSAALSVIAEAV
jgi:hypothetical protein